LQNLSYRAARYAKLARKLRVRKLVTDLPAANVDHLYDFAGDFGLQAAQPG